MRGSLQLVVHLAIALTLAATALPRTASATGVEICDNGIDDTRGLIDCADPSCAGDPACNFPVGCCVLFDCGGRVPGDGTTAGLIDGEDLTCVDGLGQAACADHVIHTSCVEDPDSQDCTLATVCANANLVEGSCAQVPGCPQFAPGVAAPAVSRTGLLGLALLLTGTGLYYVRRNS